MIINTILPFEPHVLNYDTIDASNLPQIVKQLTSVNLDAPAKIRWLLKAISLIDLTTLAGDDTRTNVYRLCSKARTPLSRCLVDKLAMLYNLDVTDLTTAAVCVYPNQVKACASTFERFGCPEFPIAAVATGFPSGQYPLNTRLAEITAAIEDGATEIDIVINRTLALRNDWKTVYDEVCAMREACGNRAHLKTILAVGELGSYQNVYRASMTCMLAGADFIKTSTGKEAVNATLPVSLVMIRAIQDFDDVYHRKVGFKPAGGLKTAMDAIDYLAMIHNYLGPQWTRPDMLRFGASSLLGNIEAELYKLLFDGMPVFPGCLDYL